MLSGAMRETGGGALEALKDPLYRLTRADRTNPGATPPNQWTWNYDQVGNRTSAQKDSEATTSSYNEKNQLTGSTGGGKMLWRGTLDEPGNVNLTNAAASINGQPARMLAGNVFEAELNLPPGANNVTIQAQDGSGNIATKVYSVNVIGVPATYTYDANGNLTQKVEGADTWVYTWNALDQLTAVTKNAATVASYSYDPRGRRVQRVAGLKTSKWTYDGANIARQEAAISGVESADISYVFGPGSDEPIAVRDNLAGATTYLHADDLGSVVRNTDGSGGVVASVAYDAWGNLSSGTHGAFGFAAREWDEATGHWYNRARWYDPVIGRFLSQDPIRWSGSANFYSYAANDPVSFVDPSGMVSVSVTKRMVGHPTNDSTFFACDRKTTRGCVLGFVRADCRCEGDCNVWRPKVGITADLTLHYNEGHPKYPPELIIYEEQRHVRLTEELVKRFTSLGEAMERQRFNSALTCGLACLAFEAMFRGYSEDWQWFHFYVDMTHPM